MAKNYSTKRETIQMFQDLNVVGLKERNGWQKVCCPICSKGRNKSTEPVLAVDVSTGYFFCHHCGWTGNVHHKKEYKPNYSSIDTKKQVPLSPSALSYLSKERKIPQAVLERNNIKAEDRYFTIKDEHGVEKKVKKKCVVFNYYVGSKVVSAKYRTRDKEFQSSKNSPPVFYKLNDVFEQDTVIITEGEIDALSYEAAGFTNAISIPNGGVILKSKDNEPNFKYIDECMPYLDGVKRFLISTDNDIVGRYLQREFVRRFGRNRCYQIKYPDGFKDANEVLLDEKHGEEAIRNMVATATMFPNNDMFTLNTREKEFMDLFEHGHQDGKRVGIKTLDDGLRWFTGNFYIITGIPGNGKSTFVDYMIILLAIHHGWKTAIYTPENKDIEIHGERLAEQLIGKTLCPNTGYTQMSKDEAIIAKNFINDHVYYVLPDQVVPIDDILAAMEYVIQKEGIKICVIDPWNTIEHRVAKFQSETNYYAETLNKMKYFAREHDVVFILVAHPVKGEMDDKSGQYKMPTLSKIAGSAHFQNIADVGIVVHQESNGSTIIFREKIKHKFMGRRLSRSTMYFDEGSQRLFSEPTDRYGNLLNINQVIAEINEYTGEYSEDEYDDKAPF